MFKNVALVFLAVCLLASFTMAQAVKVIPYGVSPRDVDADTMDIFEHAFNGLLNVGIESQLYLKGTVDGASLTSPTWAVLSQPAGSAADFGATSDMDTSTQVVSFVPDLVGTYVVEFADGGVADTLTINAAIYVGIEDGMCGICHSAVKSKWEQTGHYSLFERAMEGDPEVAGHYSSSCISCHVTGYDENANNNGFDDRDFVFPDSLFPGQWNNLLSAYPDAMKLARIQCESCHGPGSAHNGKVDNSKMVSSLSSDNCAWCHDSGTRHVYPEQWDVSTHASGSHLYAQNSSRDRSDCMPCHNGQGFVDHLKGKAQTESELIPITCATCHSPHDNTNAHQLRTVEAILENGEVVSGGGSGRLCMNCHKTRRNGIEYTDNYLANLSSHYGPHYGPQSEILLATNLPTFDQDIPSSNHFKITENGCVDCHMVPGMVDEENNIVLSGSHSFKMSTPDGVDNMEACSKCHGSSFGTSFDDVPFSVDGSSDLDGDGEPEGLQEEIRGLLDQLAMLLPPKGSLNVEVVDSSITLAEARAAYNHEAIMEDRSFGIHNPAFTYGLLKASIEAVGGTVSVGQKDAALPVEYNLSQNYPNPFNPTTTIAFDLKQSGVVTITLYNATGQQVTQILNERRSAGNHSVTFSAHDLPSGIYFYKLSVNNFLTSKKMVLMK
ncbi:T9SS type A sorting domain-containing protein [candidate division KSB1 bacterium]|nr:T9SS type A sorting domain-containing protein [candidate division KSB1 bacterium]